MLSPGRRPDLAVILPAPQCAGPYAVLAVYEATSWAPWALIAAVLALPLLLYPLRGLPLTRDPDWASLAVAREDNVPMGPLPAVDAKQVVVNTN